MKFLGDYKCLEKGRSTAHAAEERHAASFSADEIAAGPPEQDADRTDVVAMVESMHREGHSADNIAAAVRNASYSRGRAPPGAQRQGGRAQSAPSRQRARTPPRDPKDNKCANCNEKGHTHVTCPHPAKAMDKRKCHECVEEGHTARRCPDN